MIEENEKYSWDSDKRALVITKHGLDFVLIADLVFDDPDLIIKQDDRQDYGEDRYLAFAQIGEIRLCLCYTPRENKKHLITVFRIHKKQWRKIQ